MRALCFSLVPRKLVVSLQLKPVDPTPPSVLLDHVNLLMGEVAEPPLSPEVLAYRLQLAWLYVHLDDTVVDLDHRPGPCLDGEPRNLHRLRLGEVPAGRAGLLDVEEGKPLAGPRDLGGPLYLMPEIRDVREARRRYVGHAVGRHDHHHVLPLSRLSFPDRPHRCARRGTEHRG